MWLILSPYRVHCPYSDRASNSFRNTKRDPQLRSTMMACAPQLRSITMSCIKIQSLTISRFSACLPRIVPSAEKLSFSTTQYSTSLDSPKMVLRMLHPNFRSIRTRSLEGCSLCTICYHRAFIDAKRSRKIRGYLGKVHSDLRDQLSFKSEHHLVDIVICEHLA